MTVYGQLGELTDGQLQAALDRFDAGRLCSAEALTEGLFGKNIALRTDRGEWVLRGDPWPMHVDDQYRRERFFAAAVRGACDVPVPWPYQIEPDESLFGWPYALIPRLGGRLDRTDAGAAALGRAAAALRAVTFASFGEWSPQPDAIEAYTGTAAEWLALRVERQIEHTAVMANPLVESDLVFIRGLLPSTVDATPGYVHHDFKPGNVVMSDVDGRLEVTGLFDLGEGLAADPLEDLARTCWDLARTEPALAATFLRAYEEAAGVRVPLELLRAYVVFDLLVIWEFGTRPAQQWFHAPSFEAWVPTLIAGVDRATEALLDT